MTTPQRYRKKPEDIDAVQWNAFDGWDTALAIAQWCGGAARRDEMSGQQDKTYYWSITVPTPTGHAYANPGDWIISSADGVFRVAHDEQFKAMYEPAG